MAAKVLDEELCSKWILEQLTTTSLETSHQLLQNDVPNTSMHLLPSLSSLFHLFWVYFQLCCLYWKDAINEDLHASNISQELKYTTHVSLNVYEQSPVDVQNMIVHHFCSMTDVVVLCGKLAVAALRGML